MRGWWRIRGADGGDCRVMPDDGNRVNDRPRLEVRGVQCMKPAVIATLLQSDPTRVGFTQPPLPSLRPVFSSQSIRVYIYVRIFTNVRISACVCVCVWENNGRVTRARVVATQRARESVPKTHFFFRNIEHTLKSLTLKSERANEDARKLRPRCKFGCRLGFSNSCYFMQTISPRIPSVLKANILLCFIK